ncbi:Ras-specific guanine nucleotide-releasing factor 2 [Goodea atripinnis]|uniref:Ras-specific guanine nucleotide-releasing factor 2 n=1 Tax=Goodea atripinnis TaxID=208336 RepID=A0ABV0PVJ5_9TELE
MASKPGHLLLTKGACAKSVRYNEGHALYLSVVARKEGTKRGYLSKKTTENSRWAEKYFALYQNVLFYFENDQSARPSGIYLLEGCTCERAPAPKVSAIGKEPTEKQQVRDSMRGVGSSASSLV